MMNNALEGRIDHKLVCLLCNLPQQGVLSITRVPRWRIEPRSLTLNPIVPNLTSMATQINLMIYRGKIKPRRSESYTYAGPEGFILSAPSSKGTLLQLHYEPDR